MTNTSVTLQETGIAAAIDDGGDYDSARNKMMALDFATQLQEMKAIAGQPDYALGSVHAVTRDGTLVIASASGSQLASYAWGAANVIFVIGAQKLDTLHRRRRAPRRLRRRDAPEGAYRLTFESRWIRDNFPGKFVVVPASNKTGARIHLTLRLHGRRIPHPTSSASDLPSL